MDGFGILFFPLGPIFRGEPLVSGKVLVIVVRDFEGLMVLSIAQKIGIPTLLASLPGS